MKHENVMNAFASFILLSYHAIEHNGRTQTQPLSCGFDSSVGRHCTPRGGGGVLDEV